MNKNRHNRVALAALAIFLVGTATAPRLEQAIGTGGIAHAQVDIDQRPAAELSDAELEARIGTLRDLIQGGDLSKEDRKALRAVMKSDRKELLGRRQAGSQEGGDESQGDDNAAAEQEQADQTQQQTEQQPAESEQQQADQTQEQQPAESEQQQQADQTQEQQPAESEQQQAQEPASSDSGQSEAQSDDGASDAQRAARALLDGAQPASELSDEALTQRIKRAEALASDDSVRRRLRRELRQMVEADRAELDSRQAQAGSDSSSDTASSGTQSSDDAGDQDRARVSAEVQALLDDNRPASELGDEALRDRLQSIRAALQNEDLPRRQSRELRDRMRADRRELRDRVAQEEGVDQDRDRNRDGDRDRDRDRDRDQADRDDGDSVDMAALRDDRPSEELDRRELRRRIRAARDMLDRDDLSDRRRERLRAQMRGDRRELRNRRHARREERRRELREERQGGSISIEIGGDFSIGVSGNVPVAEIDDEDLMAQLTAGPRDHIDRRYTAEELEEYGDWRDTVPGVEVDTITFAFNEYQIGPEEIDELERIGVALEEILTAHPEEVFAVEGHTDAVGSGQYNQELSEKRADAVREALLEYFVIEPENLIALGYGERYLRIPTEEAERENRRVTLRRATPYVTSSGG